MIDRRKFMAAVAGAIAAAFAAIHGRKAKSAPTGKLYARAGEITTCENGHPLGIFTRDVFVMGTPRPDDWQFIGTFGMGTHDCPICSGRVMAGRGLYYFDGKPRVIDRA